MRIETKNLIIRPFEASDLESVFDYMSDEATTHYLFEGCLSREGVSEFISTPSKSYAIVLSSGELVGHIEFHLWFAERTYEIGWAINP
ncbi:MAG: GNAT family N-acetyltransferase, partial [Candidatus Promineifilaceae bacterium]